MIVYKLDASGNYAGIHECQPCPVTGGWLYPAYYTNVEPPVIEENQKLNFKSGSWLISETFLNRAIYSTTDKTAKYCETDEPPEGYTAIKPLDYPCKWDNGEWIDDIEGIKDFAARAVSARSKSERFAILDDQTIINVLSGATTDYPAYLTPANVASMIEKFKTIAKAAKASIKSATTKAEIDAILSNLKFPTEAEILAAINK